MALTLGTNVGFVATAPTGDPAGTDTTIDGSSVVVKDTSPAGAIRITEIGWYRGSGTNTANFEVALYSEAAGVADVRIFVDATNSSAVGPGWITTTVDWPISGSTAYWLGVQMDAHTGSSTIDTAASGGSGIDVRTSQTTLNNPYGGGAVSDADGMYAVYAVYQTSPSTSLNTPADASSTSNRTPVLDFTGTDAETNDIRYNVQIDTVNTFDSQGSANGTFSDNFDDNSLSGSWTATGSYGKVFERSHRFEVWHSTDINDYNQIITGSAYDINESNFFVRLLDAGNQAVTSHGAIFFLRKHADDANKIFFTVSNTFLQCFKVVAGTQTQVGSNVNYDSATHKWLRFREAGTTLYWDYSTDGSSWTNLNSLANPFGTTSFDIALQTGIYAAETVPTYAIFDSLNTSKAPLIDVVSGTDAGFANPDTGGDTDPFNSGENIQYTVQSALSIGTTYYWRVRAQDPNGSKGYGAWSSTRSFTVTSGGVKPLNISQAIKRASYF